MEDIVTPIVLQKQASCYLLSVNSSAINTDHFNIIKQANYRYVLVKSEAITMKSAGSNFCHRHQFGSVIAEAVAKSLSGNESG